MSENVSFLDEFEGQGRDAIAATTTPAMLLVAQPLSQVVTEEKVKAGHFYSSLTGEDLGDSVTVCVVDFFIVWNEWKPNQGGFVGRHLPGSIQVIGDPYKGMTTPEGNKVIETYVYIVLIKGREDLGYMMYNGTPGTTKYLRQWNTTIFNALTPSGKRAPVFANWWKVSLHKTTNKAGQPYFAPVDGGKASMQNAGYIDEDTCKRLVLPGREVSKAFRLTGPSDGGEPAALPAGATEEETVF